MEKIISLQFSLKEELMTSIRLLTGGICASAGLNIDDSEDCKVCITESLLLLKRRGYLEAEVAFYQKDALIVELSGKGGKEREENSPEEEISVALLSALVDNLTMQKQEDCLKITFGFGA